MNELTDSRPLWGSTQAGWLFAAAVAGVVAGTVVSGGVDVTRALLAIAGGALALLVLWRYQFGIVLMLLVMPLDIYGRIIPSPVTVTAFHVTLLLTLAAFGLHVLRTGERVRFSVIDLAMGALVLAALISLPDSLNQGATALGAIRLFFLWLFVLLWANMLKTRALADRATALLVATGVGTALLALAQYFVPGFEFGSMRMVHRDGQTLVRAGALFWDPNYMAAFLSITFLVALALVIHARTWRATAVWTAASGILAAGVIVTFSRTGWVGVVAGVVVLLLTAPARRRIPLLLVMVAIGTTMFSVNPGLIMDRVSSIGAVESDKSIATRYHMLSSSAEMIRDNWALGTGLAAYEYAYPEYRRLGTLPFITRPHQLPLAIWAEMGVAGLIAEILLIAGLAAIFWRQRPRGWTAMEAFTAASLVSIVLVQSWFQYYLYFEYMWLIVAFAVVANRLARADEEVAAYEQ